MATLRYWDHEEKERAELTRDQVKALLDVHLMEKGVLKVKPVELVPVPEIPDMKKIIYYQAEDYSNVSFETAEKAAAFHALNPVKLDYDYSMGSEYKYPKAIEANIKGVSCYDRIEVTNAASILKQKKAAEEQNEKAERSFAEMNKAVESCLAEVWTDWYQCQHTKQKHEKVIETWNEYLKLSNNDEKVASGFLKKAFKVEDIIEASNFTGIEIPTNFIEAKAAAAEAQAAP